MVVGLYREESTEGRLDCLGVGDSGEPLRGVLFNVVVQDAPVYHRSNIKYNQASSHIRISVHIHPHNQYHNISSAL